MNVNSSILSLVWSNGLDAAAQQRDKLTEKGEAAAKEPAQSFRQVSFFGAASTQFDHVASLSARFDKMMSMLEGVQRDAPLLGESSTVILERSRSETSFMAYSSMSQSDGVVTAEFSFQLRFRPAGETQFAEVAATQTARIDEQRQNPFIFKPAVENDPLINVSGETPAVDLGAQAPQQSATPSGAAAETGPAPAPAEGADAIVDAAKDFANQVTDSAASAAANNIDNGDIDSLFNRLIGESRAFIERVQQLIEYYRIGGPAPDPAPSDAAIPPQGEAPPAAPVAPAPAPVGETSPEAVAEAAASASIRDALDSVIKMNNEIASRIRTGGGDDTVDIVSDIASRIRTGGGDDDVSIVADVARRIRTGGGDDQIAIDADQAARISTGRGDDRLDITADVARRINTGGGDDEVSITADAIRRVRTGAGDDTLVLAADTIRRVDAGAGDDSITLDAEDAVIAFGAGGGDDVINVGNVGALGVKIDSALAASVDDIAITNEDNRIVLEFATGESLTINDKNNAGLISISVGGEKIDLHAGDAPLALDATA